MQPRYSVIIPAHNEQDRIERTLREYAAEFADSEIIVVLNACSDRTKDAVHTVRADYENVEYVEIDYPVGKGGAVRAGFLVARSPLVGFVDADGSTPASEMRRLFERLAETDAVVGSRWIPGARVTVAQPFKRRLASRAFNGLVRLFFDLQMRDTQCGAKVFRAECLQRVMQSVETSNFAFDVDLLVALKRAGFRIREEPTVWNDRSGTRVNLLSASALMLSAIVRLRLRFSVLRLIVPFFDRFFPTGPIRVHDGFSILIINWRDPKHPQSGGAETYLFEMAKRWAALGNRVEWLTAGFKGCAPHETLDGVRITRVGNAATVYLRVPWTYLSRFRDRFDAIIDAENGIPFFSPLFSLKTKLCLIFHVHKRVFLSQLPPPFSWMFAWIETRVMPWVYRNSRFVTISNTTREEMLENNFSQQPIEVVQSGVGEDCVPAPKSSVPVISYVGRLKRYKRIDALLRAFTAVRRSYPNAKLIVAGSGDQEQSLRALALRLGLTDSVEIRGYVSDAEKVEILQQSWVFVTASSMEGWGIAAIEANACGTAAICYDVPGLREAVIDGVNGLVLPDGSDLAPAILRVLTDGALRAELSRGALLRASQFSWDATAEKFLDVIMRNVAGHSFSMARVSDHWRVIRGTCTKGTGTTSEHVTLAFRQSEKV